MNRRIGKSRKQIPTKIPRTDFTGAEFDYLAKSTIMKRWAVLTVLLYALALILLTLPVALIAFGHWGKNPGPFGLQQIIELYQTRGYWLWLAVLVAG